MQEFKKAGYYKREHDLLAAALLHFTFSHLHTDIIQLDEYGSQMFN